mmetsp:Transcript_3169/g.9669  ORF Transcript_3169/g.9669 Transcript_3169/m.9669 type:complete len:208 (-) Transcript_3169:1732-2355(-)
MAAQDVVERGGEKAKWEARKVEAGRKAGGEERNEEEAELALLKSCCSAVYMFCSANDSRVVLPARDDPCALFFSEVAPSTPIFKFMFQVTRKTFTHFGLVVTALVIIDCLQVSHPTLQINSHNAHRLFLTALLISCKYFEDVHYSNRYFAHVGGLESSEEMNALELTMLKLLNFKIGIPAERFNWYVKSLAPAKIDTHALSSWLCKE